MPPKILLVEDDRNIKTLATTVLTDTGFDVKACETVKEANEIFSSWKPDLFILDFGLPDGNGIELCKQLRASGAAEIPFIFLTARGELDTRLSAFAAGAQDYVQKPFEIAELIARVNVHLGAKLKREELAGKVESLELREKLRKDLMDMVAHDMKSPLGSIRGAIEIVRKQGLISDAQYDQLLVNAESAADFTLIMLNDFLDLNQAREVGLKVVKEDIQVSALFDKLAALFAGRSRAKKVKLVCVPPPAELASVRSDWNLLFRCVANFISNALKVSDPGQEIEVACEPGGAARFVVSDRGPGVPDESKARIFEKYTSDIRNRQLVESSSGIGLAFCSAAAKALGARIWVEDRPGGGSRFLLEL